MTDELKPVCCGCGGIAKLMFRSQMFGVQCSECFIENGGYDTEAEAVTAWNTAMGTNVRTLMKVFAYDATCAVCDKKERTAKVETVEKPNVFKCSECGQYFHSTAWGSPVMYCSRCGAKLDWSGNERPY